MNMKGLGRFISRQIALEDPPIVAPPIVPPIEGKPPEKTEEEKAAEALELRWKDLKLPEGKEPIDAKLPERTVAEARKLGLSPEHAEGVLSFVNQEASSIVDAAVKAYSPGGAEWTKQVESWEAEALNDLDLGAGNPEKLLAVVTKSKAVLDKFFPKSVAKYLHDTGFGSRPDVIKGFLAIAKAAGEGAFDVGESGSKKSTETKFYGAGTVHQNQ